MKYPIGIQTFERIISEGYVYVDKTALVHQFVHDGTVYFLSRPRRFGKSLLISTLKSYFQGKKDLFRGLAMEKLETEWAEHPVFHLSFSSGNYMRSDELKNVLETFVADAENLYGKSETATTLSVRFRKVIEAAYKKTGQKVVVLVDEYDKPLLDVLDTDLSVDVDGLRTQLEEYNRGLLKEIYSVFKDADEYLRFVLLTGVTKFSQVSVFSGFNQPKDISMDRRYDALCGITKDELVSYFAEPIKSLAAVEGVSEEEMIKRLTLQYDGYHFSDGMTGIFNPFSIINCMDSQSIRDYWFATGTPTYLMRLLQHFNENINELTSKYYSPEEFVNYRADAEKPLPMIYQSGYLTIKSYNARRNKYLLDFPNREVAGAFSAYILNSYAGKTQTASVQFTAEIATALLNRDLKKLRKIMEVFFAGIPYTSHKKQESTFQTIFFSIFRLLGLYIEAESATNDGRIDAVVQTADAIFIF